MINTEEKLKEVAEKIKKRYESYKKRHGKSMNERQFKNLVKFYMKINKIHYDNYKHILSLLLRKRKENNKDSQTYFSFHQ